MENLYFEGLEKALEEDAYIKVFNCSMRYHVVRVEKIKNDTSETKLISYAENYNVLAALNTASNKIINELDNKNKVICKRTLIDNIIDMGYTLHFFKLSNNKILSTICIKKYEDYIPVWSVITDDISLGFKTINETLKTIDLEKFNELFNFVDDRKNLFYKYQKLLTKENRI